MIREGRAEDGAAIAAVQAASADAASWEVDFSYQVDVAEVDGEVVGFLVTRRLVEGESEVLNLAVSPGYRRRGVARELLSVALARWPGRWFLEVRASNNAALECYQNLGFHIIGRRKGYYPSENGKSAEVGIVMEKGK